jgi:hypothetical protein
MSKRIAPSMRRPTPTPRNLRAFKIVTAIALTLPDVEATTRYDGSPVLRMHGVFLAAPATHRSAESNTLVVRCEFNDRELLIADAPDTYYVTDDYERYPVVLARLGSIGREALRDLLSVSWRLTLAKTRQGRERDGRARRPLDLVPSSARW